MTFGYHLQKAKGRLALIWLDFPMITGRRCASVCGRIYSATAPTDRFLFRLRPGRCAESCPDGATKSFNSEGGLSETGYASRLTTKSANMGREVSISDIVDLTVLREAQANWVGKTNKRMNLCRQQNRSRVKRSGVGLRACDHDRASPGFTLFAPQSGGGKVYLNRYRWQPRS